MPPKSAKKRFSWGFLYFCTLNYSFSLWSNLKTNYIMTYIEPGTKDAFNAYVTCLRQLYLMGVTHS